MNKTLLPSESDSIPNAEEAAFVALRLKIILFQWRVLYDEAKTLETQTEKKMHNVFKQKQMSTAEMEG